MNVRTRTALAGDSLGLPSLNFGPDATPYEEQMEKQSQPFSLGVAGAYSPVTPFNTGQPQQYGANAPTPLGNARTRLATGF